MEVRPHPHDRLLLGNPSGTARGQRMVGGHQKFISVMVQWKREWTEVKELMPLKYMPYMARLFHEVTGKDLRGLGQFTGWIGLGGYYHWRVVQQGLVHLVSRLQDERRPRMPKAHPSGWPLPPRPAPTGTPAMGASVAQLGNSTNSPGRWTKTRLKPGRWTKTHLEPGRWTKTRLKPGRWTRVCPKSRGKFVHFKPEKECVYSQPRQKVHHPKLG